MTERVSRDAVVAFRMSAHGLSDRLDDDLLGAAGRCGVQNSPPGSGLLALHARARDVSLERMAAAVAGDKSLLQSWCMRGAPFYFPTADAAFFTAGALPPTEGAMRHLLPGVVPALQALDLNLSEATDLVATEIGDVLAGRRLAIDELGRELAAQIAPRLPPSARALWEDAGPYAQGQPLGEGVVHFCVRILTLRGVVCFAQREEAMAPFVLVEEWLGQSLPAVDPRAARAELLRRFLRCYGPSSRAGFARWLGVRAGDVEPWWRELRDELVEVDFGGPTALLADDLPALRSSSRPHGVRMLPPHDCYLQQRDRETIVPKRHWRHVWRTVGDPGAVLVDSEIVGIWRPRKAGKSLTISITAFDALSARDRMRLEDAADQLAPLRGASTTTVTYDVFS